MPIIFVKIPCKLLYAIHVAWRILINSFLPHSISKFLVAYIQLPIYNADSYWPCTFSTPKVFLFSMSITSAIWMLAMSSQCWHSTANKQLKWLLWRNTQDGFPIIKVFYYVFLSIHNYITAHSVSSTYSSLNYNYKHCRNLFDKNT